MANFSLSLIQGTPSFAMQNRSGFTNLANPNFTLYSSAAPPVPEGVDGSANCCTFLMPAAAGAPVPISMSLNANVLSATSTFVLQGLWKGIVIFQTPVLPSPMTPAYNLPINQLRFLSNPPVFPCRISEDFTWAIGPPGGQMIQSQPTLLEITYVWAGPPAGPVNPLAGTLARPNFGNVYPVDLFRLFLPNPGQFPVPTRDLKDWYMERAMASIWGLGLRIDARTAGTRIIQYESINGAPAYIDNGLGGTFQLRRFIRTMLATVNCYDLAGITQLAMAMIKLLSNKRKIFA